MSITETAPRMRAATRAADANAFGRRLRALEQAHAELIALPNERIDGGNGIFERYRNPALTAAHTPLFWRYDLDRDTNPYLLERLGINAVFNAGAIKHEGRYLMVARVEGADRKSFFAVAESANGIDGWRFRDYPIDLPQTDEPDVNVYDMRLTRHEDGWIYGVFCTERKDTRAPNDPSAATAQAGIARTRDLVTWQRLPDLRTRSGQQRNVVLHPEFIDGKYAFYTRPQDSFIDTGSGGGIGWGLSASIERPEVLEERIIDPRVYHTIKEVKNGQGPAPIRTREGWLHLAHGVRNTAAGLRYVLYVFVTDLAEPWRVTHAPGGYLIAPDGVERVGDVSNVVFSNGWIADDDGTVFIYYASSDTRVHVATSTVDRLLDYAMNTPPDALRSAACVAQRSELIRRNLRLLERAGDVDGMTTQARLEEMRAEMSEELTGRMLPFWMEQAIDQRHGGFVGLMTGDGVVVPDAPKGVIITSRILWTFSAAYRVLGDESYRATAERALDFLRTKLLDPVHGGVYWMVAADGQPIDERKHVYAQAFALYAVSEYARATGDERSRREAIELYELIERHARDAEHGGYQEAFSRDWRLLDDVRLSEEDADERKSMNTHLHVLEAYTNLYRLWPDAQLAERLSALIELFLERIAGERGDHFTGFFDEDWTPKSEVVSYGHDIEASWLLLDTADALGDELLRERVQRISIRVAESVLATGYDRERGGIFNEGGPVGVFDHDKEWWPQAEAIIGFVNAYQETGKEAFADAAIGTWRFVKRYMLDRAHGEWHRRVGPDGTLRPGHEKIGPWKCPYHGGRACLEIMARVGRRMATGE